MFRSVLGHTSQRPITCCLQQSTKSKSLAQPLRTIQQQRMLSGAPCLQYERKKHDREGEFTTKKKSTYSNRRFVNLEDAEKRPNRHLYTMPRDVYGTSERVAQLLKFEGIEQAHDLLVSVPLDLQSTVTWNQLLNQCGQEGRAALSETIFSQMRKRGIEPSERTFAHILSSFIGNNSPNCCERAESWIRKMESYGIQPTTYHYNTLLNVYGKAGQYNHVVAKLRQMMRDDGLMPYPDKVTLSTALQVVPLLVNNPNKEIRRIWHYIIECLKEDFGYEKSQHFEKPATQPRALSSLQAKVKQLESSDATFRNDRLLIKEQQKSIAAAKYERHPLEIDDTLVVALVRSLGRSNKMGPGRQRTDDNDEHLKLAIDIMDQLYGVRPALPRVADLTSNDSFKCFGLAPGVTVLDAIVRYCGALREFELGEAYFDMMVQKFPKLEPDARAYDAYAWMQSNTRRKSFKKSSKAGLTQRVD